MIPKEEIKIGLKFIPRSGRKEKRVHTIIDIYKTYNSKNELVFTNYVTEHEFLGQKVINREMRATSVMMGERILDLKT